MKKNEIVALKITARKSKTGLTPFEILDCHHDLSLENEGRVLYKTDTKFAPDKRVNIKQALCFVDAETAYLVDVQMVGLGGVSKIPAGFVTPKPWEQQMSNSFLCLVGDWVRVDPAEYVLDSNPAKSLVQAFAEGQLSRTYVHSV